MDLKCPSSSVRNFRVFCGKISTQKRFGAYPVRMKTVSAAEMRELDRRTIEEFGTPGEVLMERAARGLVGHILALIHAHQIERPSILLIAGKGNNGGDAEVAHRMLLEENISSNLWNVQETHWATASADGFNIIVDGLLGTGTSGAPRGKFAEAIAFINRTKGLKVAIDIPSGLNADTGEAQGETVIADLTVTMGLPKTGLIRSESVEYTGPVETVDIGIPKEYIDAVEGCTDAELITQSDVQFPRRKRNSHKGTYGHVLLIGGAPGMTGAIAMAARAALRSGAGLVSVLTPEEVVPIVAQAAGPEAMVRPLRPSLETLLAGSPRSSAVAKAMADRRTTATMDSCRAGAETPPVEGVRYSSILIGPGLGRSDETRKMVEQLLATCTIPLLLDADALRVSPETIAEAKCPVVITPHPGEFATLFETTVEQVQADRWAAARSAAERTCNIVVLKGARTIVAAPGEKLAVNSTGNPGMAKGGSGDVLAGLLAGLLAQGIDPLQATKTAVWLHGKAGDLAAAENTEAAMTATDLIDAFRSLSM